jgi:hypothetical protein
MPWISQAAARSGPPARSPPGAVELEVEAVVGAWEGRTLLEAGDEVGGARGLPGVAGGALGGVRDEWKG